VLTEIKAYSSWRSAPILSLNGGRAETDLIQIRNITGLDPVKASVNSTPFGVVDGASHIGSSVLTRNIVLTLAPNPDWGEWTYESLRRLLYSYFMPKKPIELVFYSDDMDPVKISGIVESVTVNMFSKDPELQVSVICHDPYFTSLNPKVLTGPTLQPSDDPDLMPRIDYNGTIETGMNVKITTLTTPSPNVIILGTEFTYLTVAAGVNSSMYFEMNSIPTRKFVQNVNLGSGVITNLLSKVSIQEGSDWPVFQPGENLFAVITDQGEQDWTLTYYERFGGL
jgi:hypothetical protein